MLESVAESPFAASEEKFQGYPQTSYQNGMHRYVLVVLSLMVGVGVLLGVLGFLAATFGWWNQ